MIQNLEHEQAYEYLTLIINEYESSALKSDTREGILVNLHNPLNGFSKLISQAQKILEKIQSARTEEKDPIIDIEWDKDIYEVFDGNDALLKQVLQDCLGCDLQVNFKWQVNPINLLLPIAEMLSTIEAELNRLENLLDPSRLLEGFCQAMNNFSLICIPHWTAMLISIKMLLKQYMSTSLDLKVDWTVVLGPILKGIVGSISQLIHQIVAIMVAPIDCALNALKVFEDLEKNARQTILYVDALQSKISDNLDGQLENPLNAESLYKDLSIVEGNSDSALLNSIDKRLKTKTRKKDQKALPRSVSFLTGAEVTTEQDLKSYINKDKFQDDMFTKKIIMTVAEAKDLLVKMEQQIVSTVRSLNGLVGGGLSVNIQALGLMLFVKDIIGLILTIIYLLRKGVGVKDWCSYLSENPDLLKTALHKFFNPNIELELTADKGLTLLQLSSINSNTTIPLCLNARSNLEQQMLLEWASQLGGDK